MKKRTAACFLAIGALWLIGTSAWGQMTVPELTDADVKRIIPIMKAEAAETQAALNQMGQQLEQVEKMTEEAEQRIKDFEAGKIDALAYLKQRSKYIIVPPSASYKPKLSRAVSLSLYGNPIAIFSYGIDSEAAGNLARGGEAAAVQLVNFEDIYKGPAGQKIMAAEEEFKSFFAAKSFTDFYFTKVPGWECVSPDGGAAAWFVFYNLYAQAGGKDVETIPDGPILEIGLTNYWSPGEPPPPIESTESPVPTGKKTALRLAGMSEEEYEECLGALDLARNDAADPSAIDPANMGLDYEGPVDPEMAATLEEMRVFYELRRQNTLVYKKHAAVLDPLFAAMGR
jgi:hypothetical protein